MPKKRLLRVGLVCMMLFMGVQVLDVVQSDAVETTVMAQGDADDSCQMLVRDALRVIGSACATVGVNEVCYGHSLVSATLHDPDLAFATTGDTVSVLALQTLVTRPANPLTSEWGVALMSIRADLPSRSDETVQIVLFGDAALAPQPPRQPRTNAPRITCQFENTTERGLNLRTGPGIDFHAVDVLDAKSNLEVYGQSADGGWLRSGRGWVAHEHGTLVCEDGQQLPRFDDPRDAYFAPLQAFNVTLSTGSTCDTAPSGMLIQAPDERSATLSVNGIELRVGSTGLLFGGDDGAVLNVANLGGSVDVTVDGTTASPPPGQMVAVPVDADGSAAAPASAPMPIAGIALSADFVELTLPYRVDVLPNLDGNTSDSDTTAAGTAAPDLVPRIVFSPSEPRAGASVEVNLIVDNIGDADASNFDFAGEVTEVGCTGGLTSSPFGPLPSGLAVAAGESTSLTIGILNTRISCSATFMVELSNISPAETDADNNRVTAEITVQ